MAENKKSFVLYSDQRTIIDMLPDDLAGKLFKHIYSYVNDENPVTDNQLINLAFEPIKLQLKRDLAKWSETRESRSKAGKASAEARKNKSEQTQTDLTHVDFVQHTLTNSTVNVNVNDNVNVTVNDIELNKFNFKKSLLELGVDQSIVDTFLDIRKKKKAVNSELAFNKIKTEIDKSKLTPNEAIKIACENSWKGFEAEWVNKAQATKPQQQVPQPIYPKF